MRSAHLAAPAAMTLALCACGGGGSSLASTPPPLPTPAPAPAPTPTPTSTPTVTSERSIIDPIPSPATRQATYDTMALIEGMNGSGISFTRTAAAGEVRIKTEPAVSRYTMLFNAPEIPLTSAAHEFEVRWYFYFGDEVRFGNSETIVHFLSDGTSNVIRYSEYRRGDNTVDVAVGPSTSVRETLVYDVGLSYVSLGEWIYGTVVPSAQPGGGLNVDNPRARVLFVAGERTSPSAIPLSGTATYTGSSLGYDTDADNRTLQGFGAPIDILLRADFGQSSMFAQLTRAYSFDAGDRTGGGFQVLGVDVHGTGTIRSTGDFLVPLIGTLLAGTNITPVTGSLNGAFFGPNAEQVGGVFAVGQVPGTTLVSDAFVGVKN